MARLILALLLAMFAMPVAAPAACQAKSPSHAMPMDVTDQQPEQKATPPHGCIGCVPPSNWNATSIAAALLVKAPAAPVKVAALVIGKTPAPDTPPPRGA